MGPSGNENFKTLLHKKTKVFALELNFPRNDPHQTTVGMFEISSYRF